MKQKSFHILFFVKKNKIKANGEAPIAFRITVDKQFCELYIRRSAPAENWDQIKGRLKTKDKVSTEINMYIDTVRAIHSYECNQKNICNRGIAIHVRSNECPE